NGSPAISTHDHRPCQIFPELARADAPWLERGRRLRSHLNERPMPYQRQRGGSIRLAAAHDEMIVAMHQNSNHTISCFDARIVNRMADGEMVHHLALLGRQAEITVDLIVEERANARGAQPERFGGQIQALADGAGFEVRIAIA